MRDLKELIKELNAHPDVANADVTLWSDVETMSAYHIKPINKKDLNINEPNDKEIKLNE